MKELLQKLHLSDKEIKIYLTLSKTGVQTVQQVSDVSGINRTTAYRILESLESKNLIEWLIDDRGKRVRTTPPKNLDLLLENKKQEVEELEEKLPELIDRLGLITPAEKFNTQVRYYKDEFGIRQMIWNTLHADKQSRGYAPLQRRDFIDAKFEEKFEQEWNRRGLHDKIITNTADKHFYDRLSPEYKKSIELRSLPKEKFYMTSDIMIYNNIVAIMSLEKGNLVGVEIENAEIAKTQKSLFDIVWEVAKPLTVLRDDLTKRAEKLKIKNENQVEKLVDSMRIPGS